MKDRFLQAIGITNELMSSSVPAINDGKVSLPRSWACALHPEDIINPGAQEQPQLLFPGTQKPLISMHVCDCYTEDLPTVNEMTRGDHSLENSYLGQNTGMLALDNV